MPYMYIVKCRDGTYYTGSTTRDPVQRVWEHNHDENRAARYTIKRRPVELVYFEQFERIADAFAREQQVQRWSRRKKEALMGERWDELIALSRSTGDASAGSATGCGGDASTGPATGCGGDASTGSATGRGRDGAICGRIGA
jgi:putative endonuclease